MTRVPILLDTDPGSDIDDALAIAYLAREDRCELVGVTTVSGPTEQRARVAEVVLGGAGRFDVSVHPGESEAIGGPGQPNCPHYAAISDRSVRRAWGEETGVESLRRTLSQRPGEIELLTIGPLTNVARLLEGDSEILLKARGITMMLGAWFEPFAGRGQVEWNVMCDVEAARRVFEAPRPRTRFVGLDVTERVFLEADVARERFAGFPEILVMAREWFASASRMIFHDPLAAACVFAPELVTWRSGRATLGPNGETVLESGSGEDLVAASVEAEAFFRAYFTVLERNPRR